ncbi:MAG TPA: NAD(P)H-binding protein, partial [Holophaga sp.]|nr:NAD(P)H-binding protein [Holophaga sp.]
MAGGALNITVFGASGRIGRLVVEMALSHGHKVTAYGRRHHNAEPQADNLQWVVGELADIEQIGRAVAGADIVISTLGPALDCSRKRKGTPIADGHAAILKAMREHGKRRLVTLATPTVRSREDGRFLATLLPGFLARILFPNACRDILETGRVVVASDVDWTIVRIIDPNAKHNGNGYGVSLGDRPAGMAVSRANVAAF